MPPLFDSTDSTFSDASFGLDTHEAIAGNKSIFESAGDVITKGIPLTGLSIVNSFANTAIDIGNFFGGDFKRLSMEDELSDETYKDYYKTHQQGIEAAGLLGGSLIPGTLAIKALKLAQAGKNTNILTRATNIFAGPKQATIDNALLNIESEGALYNTLQADKVKAIALGFGDQALQGLIYEAATVATMKASPLLDKDGFGDVVHNMFFGALVGGGIGGVIEGIGVRSIINKAILNADTATKSQELATYLGKGGYFAGDRVIALLDSLDNIPAPTNTLGKKKLSATTDAAMLNAKKILGTMVKGGDEDLTNGFFDTLLRMNGKLHDPDGKLSAAALNKEEMFNYLSRLDKVGRIDSPLEAEGGEIFFVNRFAKDAKGVKWDQLVSNKAEEGAEFSLGYRLKKFATDPRIARFDDTVEWEGMQIPRYSSAKEAFDKGADIYIDAKLRTYINDNAQNIERVARSGESRALTKAEELEYRKTGNLPEGAKPLYGAPVILNLFNGSVRERAIPFVGDYGAVKKFDKGLMFGDRTSLQSSATPLTAEMSAIDSNARYVWAKLEGVKKGDVIGTGDIPMLEELYRLSTRSKDYTEFKNNMTRQKVRLSDQDIPNSQEELLNIIRAAKDDLQHDLLVANPKISSEEVAQRMNVPSSYIENGGKALKPEDYMLDVDRHAVTNHVKLEYNIGNTSQQDGQILRGMMDVQYRMQLIKSALTDAVAGHFGTDFEKFIIKGTASDANIEGVGARMFSSSNSKYGSLGQEIERVGRQVTEWSTKRMAAVSEVLSSSVNAIRDDAAAAAELGMFRAVRQRTREQFMPLPPEVAARYGLDENTAVLARSVKRDKNTGAIIDWDKNFTPEGFINGASPEAAAQARGTYTFYKLSPKVADFERANAEVNDFRVVARNKWYASQGLNRSVEPGTWYTPPIDTTKHPHFALVKARPGTGLADDGVSIITAENAADLEQKIAALKDDYSIYTKDLLKTHHEVLGDYEYNRNFAQSSVDTALQRRGILNNVFPDTRAETIVKDYIDWHSKQELRLTRDYVEIGNAQLFAELRAVGERFTAAETSRTGFVMSAIGRTAPNPYTSYIKTALGISEKEEYRLWHDANEKVEAFFSTAFRAAKSAFHGAEKGLISFEEAAEVGKKFGLGNPYEAATDALRTYYEVANKLPAERYLSKFISTANSILSATAIRLDVFQSVINAVSTPVLLLAEANSARSEAMSKLLTTELPNGSGRLIPATSKLFYNSVTNWFDKSAREQWMPVYKDILAVRNKSSEYFETIDHLTLPYGKVGESALIAKAKAAVDAGGKLTGSELSEEFGRFIAADTARQIFEAAGYEGRQLTDNISTFVNRVHGNYVASQRPIAFQGPIGQAVGLFQTYQFNLLQQLFRYVENGEGKTLAILAGMQGSLFGMQGLPGFQAINNHIVGNAAGNPAHKDLYSTVPNFFDKKLGDYLLYGSMSNWMNTGLYSRGDINPRQLTILPTNPLDYPAIAGGIKFVGSLLDTSEKLAKGGAVPASLLLGLEHNGLSRPLSGLAQMVQGYATTGKGSLVATTRPAFGDNSAGLSDMFSIANFSRLLGARPLDEAVTMDAMYRKTLYQAKDNTRISALGEAVKTNLYGNQHLDSEAVHNFSSQYAASGGNIQNFGRKMIEWSQDANASVANQIYRSLKSPLNQQMMMTMGGIKLPDYTTSSTQLPPAE